MILEVELAEPSYFVEHGPGSAERFAAAVLGRLESHGGGTSRVDIGG